MGLEISASEVYPRIAVGSQLEPTTIPDVPAIDIGEFTLNFEVRDLMGLELVNRQGVRRRLKRGIVLVISSKKTNRSEVYGLIPRPIADDADYTLSDEVAVRHEIAESIKGESLIERSLSTVEETYEAEGILQHREYLSGFSTRTLSSAFKVLNTETPFLSHEERIVVGLLLLHRSLQALSQLHQAGYLHGHPNENARNFIVDDRSLSVRLIDFKFSRSTRRYSRMGQQEELRSFGNHLADPIGDVPNLPGREVFFDLIRDVTKITPTLETFAQDHGIDIEDEAVLQNLGEKFHNAAVQMILEEITGGSIDVDEASLVSQAIDEAIDSFPTVIV